MTVPELRQRRFHDSLILGTLAGSATLGLLIPPSIILIVYGFAADRDGRAAPNRLALRPREFMMLRQAGDFVGQIVCQLQDELPLR